MADTRAARLEAMLASSWLDTIYEEDEEILRQRMFLRHKLLSALAAARRAASQSLRRPRFYSEGSYEETGTRATSGSPTRARAVAYTWTDGCGTLEARLTRRSSDSDLGRYGGRRDSNHNLGRRSSTHHDLGRFGSEDAEHHADRSRRGSEDSTPGPDDPGSGHNADGSRWGSEDSACCAEPHDKGSSHRADGSRRGSEDSGHRADCSRRGSEDSACYAGPYNRARQDKTDDEESSPSLAEAKQDKREDDEGCTQAPGSDGDSPSSGCPSKKAQQGRREDDEGSTQTPGSEGDSLGSSSQAEQACPRVLGATLLLAPGLERVPQKRSPRRGASTRPHAAGKPSPCSRGPPDFLEPGDVVKFEDAPAQGPEELPKLTKTAKIAATILVVDRQAGKYKVRTRSGRIRWVKARDARLAQSPVVRSCGK